MIGIELKDKIRPRYRVAELQRDRRAESADVVLVTGDG